MVFLQRCSNAYLRTGMSTPIRWLLRIGNLVLALVILAIWRHVDAQLGFGFPGGVLRGAVVFGFLLWMWNATKAATTTVKTVRGSMPTKVTRVSVSPIAAKDMANDVPEEKYWAQALVELESGGRKPGLWARSFAEAQGSESLAQANYLNVRARQLADEHREKSIEPPKPSCDSVGTPHLKIKHGLCPRCGHYGEYCTGIDS